MLLKLIYCCNFTFLLLLFKPVFHFLRAVKALDLCLVTTTITKCNCCKFTAMTRYRVEIDLAARTVTKLHETRLQHSSHRKCVVEVLSHTADVLAVGVSLPKSLPTKLFTFRSRSRLDVIYLDLGPNVYSSKYLHTINLPVHQ